MSNNGSNKGAKEGSGTRSSLFYETLRIIDKTRPKYVLWENVPGLLSENNKPCFDEYIKIMDELGYNTYFKILCANDFGMPQERERVYTLSIRMGIQDKPFVFPKKQELKETYEDYLEPDYDPKSVVLTETELLQVDGYKGYKAKSGFTGRITEDGETSINTISAQYGKLRGNANKIRCKEGYRILTPRECWRLMGFTDENYNKASLVNGTKALYHQAGNSIVVNVLEAILKSLFNIDNTKYRPYRKSEIIDNIDKALLANKEIDEKGNYYIKFWTPNCNFTLTIKNIKKIENIVYNKNFNKDGRVNHSAVRLLEYTILKYTENHFKVYYEEFDIKEYMKDTARKDKQYTKEALERDIEILKNTTIKFRSDDPKISYKDIVICKNTTKIEGNKIHFVLGEGLYKTLKREEKHIYMPLKLLQHNENKNHNSLLLHKYILNKIGNTEQEVTIKIEEIRNYCVTLKNTEEVKKTPKKQYKQEIWDKFEHDIKTIGIEWRYESEEKMEFKQWEQSNLKVRWIDNI